MPETKTYAILTAVGAPPEQVVNSMMALRKTDMPILYLHRPGEQAPGGPDLQAVTCECETLGQMLNNVRTVQEADLLLWIPPGVEVRRDGLLAFEKALEANPEAALLVSDYAVDGRDVSIHPLRHDLTEREDFGAVWGIPVDAFDRVGGADPSLKHTTFYDLRLKLMELGDVVHVEEVTHDVQAPEQNEDAASSALYYPGRGAYGGFSYLFMDPEEEKETEEVFYRCLRRRGAWLELPDNEVVPAPLQPGAPLATVVIPVHNRASFLPRAVASVMRSSMQDFEIIIIDNASTDDTREVADRLAAEDERIQVLHSEVNLIARALNMGVSAARGRYIAQLDSDDEYTVDTLSAMTHHLETHPKAGLAISYYELMNEEGQTLEDFGIIKHLEYNRNNILRVDGAGAVRVWHRSVINEFGGFNEVDFPNYGEDYDLVLKVSERYHVDRVHEVLYRYRRHPGNTDVLRRAEDKIEAKTLARKRAIGRRRKINGVEGDTA